MTFSSVIFGIIFRILVVESMNRCDILYTGHKISTFFL